MKDQITYVLQQIKIKKDDQKELKTLNQSLVQFKKDLSMLENGHKEALLCQDNTTADVQSIEDYTINAPAMKKKNISKLEKDLDSSTTTVKKQQAKFVKTCPIRAIRYHWVWLFVAENIVRASGCAIWVDKGHFELNDMAYEDD